MGQIIKQPNGKYCLFSSVIDKVTYYDCTPKEIVDIHKEEAISGIEDKVMGIIKKLDSNENPYYQFTLKYEDMLNTIKKIHGQKESDYTKKIIEKL